MLLVHLLSLTIFAATALCAQSAFEAASVKPSQGSKAGNFDSSGNSRPDNLEFKNATLRTILVEAFEIKDYQLSGPAWMDSERFDILAKAPPHTSDKELMPMLRNLLAQRFRLEVHREKRQLPCFALLVARGGPKLKAVEPGDSNLSSTSRDGGGELTGAKVEMDSLAEWLSREEERPVLDLTGLKGSYDFTLKYSRESARGLSDTPEHPVVALAIEEQLGLRLEKRTAPVDVVVVDRVERVPVEN